MEAILPHLTAPEGMGCEHVVYADTSRPPEGDLCAPISQRPKLAPTTGRHTAAADRSLPSAWRISASRMAFHHHMGTIVETDAEVGLLMATPARPSACSTTAAIASSRAATRWRC